MALLHLFSVFFPPLYPLLLSSYATTSLFSHLFSSLFFIPFVLSNLHSFFFFHAFFPFSSSRLMLPFLSVLPLSVFPPLGSSSLAFRLDFHLSFSFLFNLIYSHFSFHVFCPSFSPSLIFSYCFLSSSFLLFHLLFFHSLLSVSSCLVPLFSFAL